MEYLKHEETGHEMHEDDLDDRKDMLEEAHAHAVEHGPEHHATLLKGMLDECDEYEPNEDSEESDEEDEDERDATDANDKPKENDEKEKKDSGKGGIKGEDSDTEKESDNDVDRINKYVSGRRK